MDTSLKILCDGLKRVAERLKPDLTLLSFVIVVGKLAQGKRTLLQQSHLIEETLETDTNAALFYGTRGLVLVLDEDWLTAQSELLTHTFKKLNKCHAALKITGMMICVNGSELLATLPLHQIAFCESHIHVLKRFNEALGYTVDIALMLTEMDKIAGFTEFFQYDHEADLKKPLGFSLPPVDSEKNYVAKFQTQFETLLSALGQPLLRKLHPVRDGEKRTLIREFPLQLASLRIPLQRLLQMLYRAKLPVHSFFMSSARQHGARVDAVNQKMMHEYSLVLLHRWPQSNHQRAYFIEGALKAFQIHTQRASLPYFSFKHKMVLGGGIGLVLSLALGIINHHWSASQQLDDVSKTLLRMETLRAEQHPDNTAVIYQLSKANDAIESISDGMMSGKQVQALKDLLEQETIHTLRTHFLPDRLKEIERVMNDRNQPPFAHYQALKVYLMLSSRAHFSMPVVYDWFKAQHEKLPRDRTLSLLIKALTPFKPVPINMQVVTDTRNYLNALPAAYLFYSLAKPHFDKGLQSIQVPGFDMAANSVPHYFTKSGFKVAVRLLPKISSTLQAENWVLERQDLDDLLPKLQEAYCYDYVSWWQRMMQRTRPTHYQDYAQANALIQTLHKTNAISILIHLIQAETSPDLSTDATLFNSRIASQFTTFNLMSDSTGRELTDTVNELEKFIGTLSLVRDDGQTVFNLTKARFLGEGTSDSLSALYSRAKHLPEPVSSWAKQLADDMWFFLIKESQAYLNRQWESQVMMPYQQTIAKRYPLDATAMSEISVEEFDQFFSPNGTLRRFFITYLKPFLETTHPQWQPKNRDGYVMPITAEVINELIRANVIANMFFPEGASQSRIEFSLQKINLDPVVSRLQLVLGRTKLNDTQDSEGFTLFQWPEIDAKLTLSAIEGGHYVLEEKGIWAFFKMLQKVNVIVDSQDSASLQILFEVNGNSGRYVLKTNNPINPFSPGILTGFVLPPHAVNTALG